MVYTKEKQIVPASTPGELTTLDMKKWLINMIKYVLPALMLSVATYIQTNHNNWSWVGLGTALLGAFIDIMHRWLANNQKPL